MTKHLHHRTRRSAARGSSAVLLATVIGFSGIAAAPVAATAADQNQSAEQGASETKLKDAQLSWGIKESFRRYLKGPIARGSWELDGVTETNGVFGWSEGTGKLDAQGKGEIAFPGTVRFVGHHGILDLVIRDVRLRVDGKQGQIVANVKSRPLGSYTEPAPFKDFPDTVFATVDLSKLERGEKTVSVDEAPAVLSDAGNEAFANFYSEPDQRVLDPISFTATVGAPDAAPDDNKDDAKPTPTPTPNPTSTPSPKPTPTPSPTPTPTLSPTPKPKDDSKNSHQTASTKRKVSSSSLDWGVKQSFRRYIQGPIARGSWTVSPEVKDADGVFGFQKGTGFYDAKTKTGQITYPGSVRFTGHHGILDVKFSNMRLQIREGKGILVADVDYRPFESTTKAAPMKSAKNIAVANVDLSGLKLDGDRLSVANAPVTMAKGGVEVFGGQYQPGAAMDPLSFDARLGESLADSADTSLDEAIGAGGTTNAPSKDHADQGSAGSGDHAANGAGSQADQGAAAATSSTSTNPGHADLQCVPVTVTERVPAAAAASDGKVQSATLDWGLKTSFRNYISGGIAKGKWELSGVTYGNGAYSWSNGTGEFKNGSGSIDFPGKVRFTGHKGILDLKISGVRLEIKGSSGILHATVSSNDMEGKNKDYGSVPFADVDLSGLNSSGGTVSVKGAKTTLRSEGSSAFAGFYSAGQELDPLSFSATIAGGSGDSKASSADSAEVRTRTVYRGPGCSTEDLASTGAKDPMKAAGIGLAVLGVGAGAAYLTRRRTSADRA